MKHRMILLAGVCSAAFGTSAQAQQATPPEPVADGLTEIVVTAQKREQNLQDVPVAVTAVTGDALVAKNITQFENLAAVSPSLTITSGTNSSSSSINLRGIGTFAYSIGVEPSVAVVVDDVAILQQAQAFSGLNDIERIEVLRGPQGTLFGKSASAGVVNIVTKLPTEDLTGRIALAATTDEEYRVEAGLSGPLGEGIGFRLNGYFVDRRGYIENLTNNTWLGGERSWGIRGRITARLADTLDISLTAEHTDLETNGTPRTYRTLPAGAVGFRQPPFAPGVPLAPTAAGMTPGSGNYKVRMNVDPFNTQRQTSLSGKATLDLGAVNLLWISSYQDWKFNFVEDVDNTDIAFFGPAGVVQSGPTNATVFSQELRLVSTGAGPFQYLAGLYYANGETDREFLRTPNGPLFTQWRAGTGTKTYAAFAQGTYDIGTTTHVDAGIRFNREKIDVYFQRLVPGNCTVTCAGRDEDDHVTYKVALRQDLADGIMAYASYATGYKGQGYDVSTSFSAATAARPVRAETSKAYEVGFKSRFLDNRIQLNVAAFLTDYDQFQAQSAVVQPDLSIVFQLNNVGKLRTKGVEVEFAAKPVDGLLLGATAAYIDATIVEFPFANCYTGQTAAQGCFDVDGAGPSTATAQNLAGGTLANSPKFKYTLSIAYDVALAGAPFDAFVTLDWRHQSGINFDLAANPLFKQEAYGILNGSIGIKDRDGGYRITLFANNLFNQHYAAALSANPGASAGVVNQVLPRDSRRYFGIRAAYNF